MPTRTYSAILADVRTLLRRNLPSNWRIERWKDLKGFDPNVTSLADYPLAVIMPSQQFNEDEAMEGVLLRRYRVGVALISAGKFRIKTDVFRNPDLLDEVPKALHLTSLPTATTVYDSELDFSPTYDTRSIPMGYDLTLFDVFYLSSESRTL